MLIINFLKKAKNALEHIGLKKIKKIVKIVFFSVLFIWIVAIFSSDRVYQYLGSIKPIIFLDNFRIYAKTYIMTADQIKKFLATDIHNAKETFIPEHWHYSKNCKTKDLYLVVLIINPSGRIYKAELLYKFTSGKKYSRYVYINNVITTDCIIPISSDNLENLEKKVKVNISSLYIQFK